MTIIKPVESREIWDGFLLQMQPNTFLHSWQWGEFQEGSGERIWRLGVFDTPALQHDSTATLIGIALIIKVTARRGAFLFCPHGPLFTSHNAPQPPLKVRGGVVALIDYLKPLAHAEGCSFVRFSPLMIKTPENEKLWREAGFREAPIHMHPELAWILDITPSEDELLKNMRKTTRYSIRKAEKDGVKVTTSANPEDIEKFWAVYSATAERQHFVSFSKEYLRKELETFIDGGLASGAPEARPPSAALFFGTYKGEIISTAFVVFTPWSGFYHHGASISKYASIPASQLVQWHAIMEAKRRGCEKYNFWGVVPETAVKHPWQGLSRFKRGFGGYTEAYVHAKDQVCRSRYWITYAIETLRRMKRRL